MTNEHARLEAALIGMAEAVGRIGDPELSHSFREFMAARKALDEATHATLEQFRKDRADRATVTRGVN